MSASTTAATTMAFASAVLGVAPYIVANKFKNIYEVKHYGKNKVISCCVMENAQDPATPGAVRRCTLALSGYEDQLIRESLVSITEVGEGNGVAFDATTMNAATGGEVHKTIVELAYLPCGESEGHRCAFPHEACVAAAKTVCTVSSVSNAVNRCYIEMETTVTYTHANSLVGMDDDTRLRCKTVEREVHAFWVRYLDAMVYAMEAAVLSESYPILSSTVDVEFRAAYEAAEETFCQWAASNSTTLPRQSVMDQMEAALLAWSRVLREYRHMKLSAETAKGDVAGTRQIAAETARQLADRTAAVENLQQQLTHMLDTDTRHKEFVTMNATVTAMRHTLENQQRARQLLVEKHRREYSSQPGIASIVGHNEVDSLFPALPELAPRSRQHTVSMANDSTNTNNHSNGIAAPTMPFNKSMLAKLFGPNGTLDDAQANEVFHALLRLPTESSGAASVASGEARKRGEYVTMAEMQAVLLAMDHQGLYEDVDGTQEQLARWRSAVQVSFADRYGTDGRVVKGAAAVRTASSSSPATTTDATNAAAAVPEREEGEEEQTQEGDSSNNRGALAKMVARHNAETKEQKAKAMSKLAEDTVARYAFRESGRLYFDEFCLALMHLLK